MYTSYSNMPIQNIPNVPINRPAQNNQDRIIGGGFLGPFILGGITGGLAAPLFYGPGYGRPYYSNNYYYPYPYYGPYYR